MEPIKVVVHGAQGKVGQEVVKAVCREPGMRLVGAVDMEVSADVLSLPDGSGTVPFSSRLEDILNQCPADVMVDFTVALAALPAARTAMSHHVNLVIGTTGLSKDEIGSLADLAAAQSVGVFMAPNFALGAVLMMHVAAVAAKYLDYAEIIELHHNQKADAPSGTALTTARNMATARGKPFLTTQESPETIESRGKQIDGIPMHSVRLPGLLAHQEVLLGAPGQTLSIRHDTISRECFMPGVLLAIREVVKRKGLIYGLDKLLEL